MIFPRSAQDDLKKAFYLLVPGQQLMVMDANKENDQDHVMAELVENSRSPTKKADFPNPLYSCDLCGGLKFGLMAFLKHQKSHINDLPYKCHQCKKKFKTLSDFRAHRRVAHKVHKSSAGSAGSSKNSKLSSAGASANWNNDNFICPQCKKGHNFNTEQFSSLKSKVA
jgi:hypothetical protein